MLLTPRGAALDRYLPGLLAIEAACFPAPWDAAALREEADHPHGFLDLLLCTDAGQEVAAFCCGRQLHDELHVFQIATHPRHRRQGLAARLLRHAQERAAQGGCQALLLEVRAGNHAALALYQRLGLRVIARRPRYYPDGEDALLLRGEAPL